MSVHPARYLPHAASALPGGQVQQDVRVLDGWVVEYIKPLHKGGADEVGNKHLLCRECFEEKRH